VPAWAIGLEEKPIGLMDQPHALIESSISPMGWRRALSKNNLPDEGA